MSNISLLLQIENSTRNCPCKNPTTAGEILCKKCNEVLHHNDLFCLSCTKQERALNKAKHLLLLKANNLTLDDMIDIIQSIYPGEEIGFASNSVFISLFDPEQHMECPHYFRAEVAITESRLESLKKLLERALEQE